MAFTAPRMTGAFSRVNRAMSATLAGPKPAS
jgi:hypothetical protein